MRLDSARRALAESRDLSEIKAIRDQAEAMRQYARAAQMGLEAQNHAAEIKLRAERRAGELLAGLEKNTGTRGQLVGPGVIGPSTVQAPMERPKLADLGISHTQSSRWQTVAAVPEPVFEEHVAQVRGKVGGEITSSAVVDLGRHYQAAQRAATRDAKEQERAAEPPRELPFEIEVADATALPLDSNTVDLIVTSPPYGLDKPYAGMPDLADGWEEFTYDWLKEAYRVAADGGRIAINVPLDTSSPTPRPTFPQLVAAAMRNGWNGRMACGPSQASRIRGRGTQRPFLLSFPGASSSCSHTKATTYLIHSLALARR
jgi:hypothetical protein